MLICPHCRGNQLEVRRRVGFERFLSLTTQKRKYRCVLCSFLFRARDRRAAPGEGGLDDVTVVAQPANGYPSPEITSELKNR